MPEIEIEMVSMEDIEEELLQAKKAGGGKWVELIKNVLETGNAAVVTGLSKGQIAAASKACKGTTVKCRTFYNKGKAILYQPEE